jgi:hypothetical protein
MKPYRLWRAAHWIRSGLLGSHRDQATARAAPRAADGFWRWGSGECNRYCRRRSAEARELMAGRTAIGGFGLTLGGAIVIAGIVIAIFWSVVLGVIVALIGLLAFGGFAKGRWY